MAFAKSILVPAEEILRISCLHDGNESFETTRACIRVFAIRSESRDRPMPIVRVNIFFFSFTRDSLKNQMTRLVERTRSIQDSHKPDVKKKILITVAIFSNALAYI